MNTNITFTALSGLFKPVSKFRRRKFQTFLLRNLYVSNAVPDQLHGQQSMSRANVK